MTRVANTLLALTLGLLLIHTVIYFAFAAAVIPFPFDYDQAEGIELNNALLIAEGGCAYCSSDSFPFFGIGYPPFFHLLMAPFVKLFGPAFWYGRAMIFAATLATAGMIGWAVYRDGRHRLAAILAGLAFLASNYVYHIGPLLRQHLLMVTLETAAIVVVAGAFDGNRVDRRKLAVALALLLCAGYTKQLAYASCIAVAIWLFLRHPRIALRYSAGLIAAAGLVFGLLMMATENQWWVHIISSNQNPYDWDQYLGLMRQFLGLHGWLVALALGMVAYEMVFGRLSAYAIWLLAALANTVTAGKWGAGDSYFVTALAACCILGGTFLSRSLRGMWMIPADYPARALRLGRWVSGGSKLALLSALLFFAYALAVFKMPTSGPVFAPLADAFNIKPLPSWRYPLYDPAGWTPGYAVTGHLPSAQDYDSGWEIVEHVRQTRGLVLSEDAGFIFHSDHEVIGNSVHMRNLWENALYDPGELIGLIESGEIGLIILRGSMYPPPVLGAITKSYRADEIISMNGFDYQLWRPISASSREYATE